MAVREYRIGAVCVGDVHVAGLLYGSLGVGNYRQASEYLARGIQSKYNICMADLRFEWDERKNRANVRKHGVRFEEAQTVFFDEEAIRYDDPEHSDDESRFLMLGVSYQLRVLVVSHCYRSSPAVIRMITARKANTKEEAHYWSRR